MIQQWQILIGFLCVLCIMFVFVTIKILSMLKNMELVSHLISVNIEHMHVILWFMFNERRGIIYSNTSVCPQIWVGFAGQFIVVYGCVDALWVKDPNPVKVYLCPISQHLTTFNRHDIVISAIIFHRNTSLIPYGHIWLFVRRNGCCLPLIYYLFGLKITTTTTTKHIDTGDYQ